jgi:exportin-T
LTDSRIADSGIHNPDTSLRGRIFYLLHRFIKDTKDAKSEFYAAVSLTLIERIRPVLDISVELPEPESPEQDLLDEAIKTPGLFDNQLYLFESVGTLVSVLPNQKELPSVLQVRVIPSTVENSKALKKTFRYRRFYHPSSSNYHKPYKLRGQAHKTYSPSFALITSSVH